MEVRPEKKISKNYTPHDGISAVIIAVCLTVFAYTMYVLSTAQVTLVGGSAEEGLLMTVKGSPQLSWVAYAALAISILVTVFNVFLVPKIDYRLITGFITFVVFGLTIFSSLITSMVMQATQRDEVASVIQEELCNSEVTSESKVTGPFTCEVNGESVTYELVAEPARDHVYRVTPVQ